MPNSSDSSRRAARSIVSPGSTGRRGVPVDPHGHGASWPERSTRRLLRSASRVCPSDATARERSRRQRALNPGCWLDGSRRNRQAAPRSTPSAHRKKRTPTFDRAFKADASPPADGAARYRRSARAPRSLQRGALARFGPIPYPPCRPISISLAPVRRMSRHSAAISSIPVRMIPRMFTGVQPSGPKVRPP